MYDRAAMATVDGSASLGWRPQAFGTRSFRHIDDPIVEPLWSGTRILAHVEGDAARLVDGSGRIQTDASIAAALARALRADSAVLDGYLTTDASSPGEGVFQGAAGEGPTPSDMARQMVLGGAGSRSRDSDRRGAARLTLEDVEAQRRGLGPTLVLVAVDLLALDEEPLLDVPLLERRRLLDAVLEEDELVRRGVHVRPPIDTWVTTWRAMGFRAMTYKSANSRYRPGEANDAWTTTPMPQR